MNQTSRDDPITGGALIDKGDQWEGVEAGTVAGPISETNSGDDDHQGNLSTRLPDSVRGAELLRRLSLGQLFKNSWKGAGFTSALEARKVLDSPGLRAQAMHLRDSWIKTEGAAKAIHRLNKLMDDGVSPSVQLGAAKLVLELAGHAKGGDAAEKPMAEMTEAELQDLIDRMERQMAGGKSPVIKIKP